LAVIEHKKSKGHEKFRTVIRHHKNGVYFLMEDALVSKVEKKFANECQAYILLYALKAEKQDRNIRHNISSQRKLIKEKQLKIDEKDLVFVPGYWYEKLMTLKRPGKLLTDQYVCPHKLLKPDFYDCFPFLEIKNCKDFAEFYKILVCLQSPLENIDMPYEVQMNRQSCQTKITNQRISFESVTLPKAIVEYLTEKFGGNSFGNEMKICQTCLLYSQNLRQRKILERSLVSKYMNLEDGGYAVLDIHWHKKWKQYLYSEKRFSTRHFIKGYPFPEIIDNKSLLLNVEEGIPLHNLKKDEDYVIVNGFMWKIFQKLYGGGMSFFKKKIILCERT